MTAAGAPLVRFAVHNRGLSHARLSGEIRLLAADGSVAFRQPVSRVVLEGQVGQVRAVLEEGWRELPSGRYKVAFALQSYEGSVPVRLASPPVLDLPWGTPTDGSPPSAGAAEGATSKPADGGPEGR